MYEPNSGINIPRFTIPGVPDLEDALNSLSDAIAETASRTKTFENSSSILAIDNGSSVYFDLLDQEKQYIPKRFEISYDRYRQRLYVYEGAVTFRSNGKSTTVIPTIDRVKILLPDSPGFSDLNIERPASFDVKEKLPINQRDTPVWKVFLKVLLSAEDERDRFSIILHNYTEKGHPSQSIDADLFFQIGEVYRTNGILYIDQKWSSDLVIPDVSNCTFQVSDITQYPQSEGEEWPSTSDFKIRIQNAKVLDRYPDGMAEDTIYKITLGEELLEKQQFYVYAKIMLDEYGVIQDYDKAVTIELSEYWLPSGSCIQRIPIARVAPVNTAAGTQSAAKYILEIENYCPLVEVKKPNSCDFEVEDASDNPEQLKIQVKRTAVDDKYPKGMEDKDSPYQLPIPAEGDWFAVYVVVQLNDNGTVSEEENAITLGVYDEYKTNESSTLYFLIAEVTVSLREDSSRYISFIKNFCTKVSVKRKELCAFELYDASNYNDEGLPINAKVLITNTSVFGGRYPDGMDQDGRYVVQITQEDTKLNGVLPSIGICYIYLKVLVDEFGEVRDGDTSITIEKTSRWYQDRGCSIQRFLIGSVQVENDGGNPKFLSLASMCPIVNLGRDTCCPFFVDDASDDNGLKVQIRTGKIAGKYPQGMLEKSIYVLELPKNEDFHIIYCVSVLTADGYLYPNREHGDEYVSFLVAKDYVQNTENLQYDIIAIVNTNEFEIISIQNSCYEPVFKKPEECSFALYDASDYENTGTEEEPLWKPINTKVLVTQSHIRGMYPTGMSADPEAKPFILSFGSDDFENWGEGTVQRCYVYLLVLVDDTGKIYETENSVTIETSPYWYPSDNSTYQRILLGWVDATLGATVSDTPTIYSVQSECPDLALKKPTACLFKIEDASNLSLNGEKKITIKNGKINGKYPEGMDGESIYTIELPETTVGEYYVYAVISVDADGNPLPGQDGGPERSFLVDKEYKQNTATEHYVTIGTVYLDDNGQLTIQSYCIDPSLKNKELCPFELYDASNYDEDGNATNAEVLVSNYSVLDGRYPKGMDSDSRYTLTITPEDTKIGNEIPSIGTCYVYLEIVVDEYGEVPSADTSISIRKSSVWHQDRGCSTQRFLIGSVQVENESGVSKFLSVSPACPVVSLNRDSCCPFFVEDVSDEEGLKVQIRTGTVGGKYPSGMSERGRYILGLPQGEDFHIIYCVSVLTADGYLYPNREHGDEYVSFLVAKDYVQNTENLQYDIIAIVNTNEFEIVSIQNSCYEPVFKKPEGCDFKLYDASDYENTGTEEEPKWEATNTKVLVTQSHIRGVYPTGMSSDVDAPDYVLTFSTEDFTSWESTEGIQRSYVYLKVLVNDDDEIYGLANSVTLETSPFWVRNDNHTYQRILIGWVEAVVTNGGSPKMVRLESICPDLVLNKQTYCPFKIEDASDLTVDGPKEIMIRNGKINKRYPSGMSRNTIYTLTVPDTDTSKTYYVYAVISIDQYGRALPGQDGGDEISFDIYSEYKYNTADTYYAIIGTVEFDDDKQLIITSYCVDPSIDDAIESCNFKTTDASTWPPNSTAPSKIAVRIKNSKVDNVYPDGMGDDVDFVLELNPTSDFNEAGICYIYARAELNPSGEVPKNSQDKPLTIEVSSKFQPKGNYVQHIPISQVYIANVIGGTAKEIVKITNFCPSGELFELNRCPFYTEDVTDYSKQYTKLSVLVGNANVHGGLPYNMSSTACLTLEFSIDSNIDTYYVCCKIPTGLYGVYDDGNILISVEKTQPKSTSFVQWFVLATIYVDIENEYIWDIQNYCYIPEAKPRSCFFEVTDATDYESSSNTTLELKVEVDKWALPNTSTATNSNGIIPEGMDGSDRYILTLQGDAAWYGVFLNVQVNQQNEILTTDGAVTVNLETYMPEGTSTYQRFYIAGINIDEDDNGKRYISYIDNQCPYVEVKSPPICPFMVEDASTSEKARVQIRSGKVADTLPFEMNLTDTFILDVDDDYEWGVVYCRLEVVNGVIQKNSDKIVLFISYEYLADTSNYVYFKLAEFQVYTTADNTRYVGWVLNSCTVPFVAASSKKCWFAVTDASTEDAMKVKVAQDMVLGKYPVDMGLNYPPFILNVDSSGFVYLMTGFDADTLDLTDSYVVFSDAIIENTYTEVYTLIATVIVNDADPPRITAIDNICDRPFPNPCSLKWEEQTNQ